MNFLSHFYFYSHPTDNYYNTGLVLPDFIRIGAKGERLKLNGNFDDQGSEINSLVLGAADHFKADKIFHASTYFTDFNALIGDILKAEGFSKQYNRTWFISHILLELMIDRVIIKENTEALNAFYFSLTNTDTSHLDHFLELHQIANRENFIDFFEHFRKIQYMHSYTDNDKFVYAINRIAQRAGLNKFEPNQESILQE